MAEAGSFEVFDFTRLGDPYGGVGGIRTYSKTIVPYLRTAQYDAFLRGADVGDLESPARLAQETYSHAVARRIARGELRTQDIIPRRALETTHDDSEEATRFQVGAMRFLGQLVRGGMDVRIAASGPDEIISPEAAGFSLIEYQDGRRGELVVTTPEGEHLVMAREDDSDFTQGSDKFNTVREDPSTIQARGDVMNYLFDTATRLEQS